MAGDTPPSSGPKSVPDVDQPPVEEQPQQESSPVRTETASVRRWLSRRAVVGGGAFVAAVVAGVGTAGGGGLYQLVFGRDPLAVTVTAIGVSPQCSGFEFLVDRAHAQVANKIAQLEAYSKRFPADMATVRNWLALSADDAAVKDLLLAVGCAGANLGTGHSPGTGKQCRRAQPPAHRCSPVTPSIRRGPQHVRLPPERDRRSIF